MKVLYSLNSGQPGGMEYHTLDLVKGMVNRGHEVHVWCNNGPISNWYREAGAKVTEINIGFDIDPKYIWRLARYITKNEIQILHSHELKAVLNTLIAGRCSNAKATFSHTHTAISQWPISFFKKKLFTLVYSLSVNHLATQEIALTKEVKRVKLKEGIKAHKIKIISNGFDSAKFVFEPNNKSSYRKEMSKKYNFPNEKFVFGNMSRLSANKGTDNLLLAYRHLLNSNSGVTEENSHLLLAGKGEMFGQVRSIVEELDLQKCVTITGTFPDEDHIQLYNSIDAFVFPSLSEGFGLVLIEAMSLNIPVISSDLPVLKEVAQKYVYRYFDPLDHTAIATSMLDVFSNYDEALLIADGARKFVNSAYSIESFITCYENLYKEYL